MTLENLRDSMSVLGANARYILKETPLELQKERTFRDIDNYRTELVQVAAVALAALTDLEMQRLNLSQEVAEECLICDILIERKRQDQKFQRKLPIGLDPLLWQAVLIEEIAEVGEEIEE